MGFKMEVCKKVAWKERLDLGDHFPIAVTIISEKRKKGLNFLIEHIPVGPMLVPCLCPNHIPQLVKSINIAIYLVHKSLSTLDGERDNLRFYKGEVCVQTEILILSFLFGTVLLLDYESKPSTLWTTLTFLVFNVASTVTVLTDCHAISFRVEDPLFHFLTYCKLLPSST